MRPVRTRRDLQRRKGTSLARGILDALGCRAVSSMPACPLGPSALRTSVL